MTISQIPISKLDEGIEKTRKQVKSFLDSSNLLYEKRRYVESIHLSILGKEETTKIRIFRTHKKLKKPITNTEWKLLLNHKTKLTLPYITSFEKMRKKSNTEIIKLNQIMKKFGMEKQAVIQELIEGPLESDLIHLESLDYLKQDCLYLNWVSEDWFSVNENFSQEEKKSIAKVLLTELKLDHQFLLLALHHTNLRDYELLRTSEGKKIKIILKEMRTSKYKIMENTTKKIIVETFHQRVLEDRKRKTKKKMVFIEK